MGSKTQSYNENFLSLQQPTKNVDSSRKPQIKKQVFGEIKNVIHNQGIATPLKLPMKSPSKCSPFVYVRDKQNKNEFDVKCNFNTEKTKYVCFNAIDDLSLLDHFDFRGQCCLKDYKSDQQIWSEMNLYEDSFLNKIIDDGRQHQNEETICEIPIINESDIDTEFCNDIKDEYDYNYWPDTKDFIGESDIHVYLEKPQNSDLIF